jgi:hypothetical protein
MGKSTTQAPTGKGNKSNLPFNNITVSACCHIWGYQTKQRKGSPEGEPKAVDMAFLVRGDPPETTSSVKDAKGPGFDDRDVAHVEVGTPPYLLDGSGPPRW